MAKFKSAQKKIASQAKHGIDHEIVYGVHPILELLKAKRRKLYAIYTTKETPKAWAQIQPLLPDHVIVHYVDKVVLEKLAQTTDHQSVVGLAAPFVIQKVFFNPKRSPFLLLLDSIQDPRNLGAILRSAYCTGVDGVIICDKSSAPLNAVALKSSAGLAEHVAIYQAPSAQMAVQELKKAGYAMYMATINGKDAMSMTYTEPLCIVIGNEATGISKHIIKDGIEVRLAQKTADISYNASVAAGILLFMVSHQLKKI